MKRLGLIVLVATVLGCSNNRSKDDRDAESVPVDPVNEEPIDPTGAGPGTGAGGSPEVNSFIKSEIGAQQRVRKDSGQILMLNGKGEVAVAGVTRSKIVREPGLGGDVFFTRYSIANGWDAKPVQVPVQTPAQGGTPKPLIAPLVEVKGGRLLENGKALVVGDMRETAFSSAQMYLDETKAAKRTPFLAVFAAGENGMMKSVRYGLTGDNTIIAVAATPAPNSIYVAGLTTTGLRRDQGDFKTETAVGSNFVAEIDDEGDIIRHLAWPLQIPAGGVERLRGIAANAKHIFVGFERGSQTAFVKSLKVQSNLRTFMDLPERQVCAEASAGATSVSITSVDASETEVVVAVEIAHPSISNDMRLPCFEVFEIKPHGALASKREFVYLRELPTIGGTTRATIVGDGRIMLVRSRANTDSRGQGEAVVTFLYERPLARDGYQGTVWTTRRPKDWYDSDVVDGLKRRVSSVVWPKGGPNQDVLWILSNDLTSMPAEGDLPAEVESIIHLGSYRAIPK